MARQGETITNPVTGERITFRKTARETDGRSLEFDYYLEPGGFVVAGHEHPNQQERLEILEGNLDVSIDGDRWTATPGTTFEIPPGVEHRVWNDGDEEVRVRTEIRPALNIETFFETLFGLAREGKTNAKGRPNPLQLAVMADAFSDEIRFARIPAPLQRAVAFGLAPLGRLAGYRAQYPEYGSEQRAAAPDQRG